MWIHFVLFSMFYRPLNYYADINYYQKTLTNDIHCITMYIHSNARYIV